jgi:hypothetical protein
MVPDRVPPRAVPRGRRHEFCAYGFLASTAGAIGWERYLSIRPERQASSLGLPVGRTRYELHWQRSRFVGLFYRIAEGSAMSNWARPIRICQPRVIWAQGKSLEIG